MTYTPPPAFAKAAEGARERGSEISGCRTVYAGGRLPCPYDAKDGFVTMQPWFPFTLISQSVELISVLDWTASDECVHPCGAPSARVACWERAEGFRAPRGGPAVWLKDVRG